jgi:catechol 2,3-dioxygenase-like lactoylglutathione lyase family enzyme
MVSVVDINHLTIRAENFRKSKRFYDRLLGFLGFEREWEFDHTVGWNNGKTMFWIGGADAKGKKHKHRAGNIDFRHFRDVGGVVPVGTRRNVWSYRKTFSSPTHGHSTNLGHFAIKP